MKISRRCFIRATAGTAAAGAAAALTLPSLARGESKLEAVAAMHWKALEDKNVKCTLCARGCEVSEGMRGFCQVRENRDGKYYTLVHSRPVALHNDPIEKKPFFHYRPSTLTMSIATAGCNFTCTFCQNWEISQFGPEEVPSIHLPPKTLVEKALSENSRSLAFTYNEPTVFYEYMYDSARLARENGLGACVVSNGYIRKKPLKDLLDHVDAYRVDFKSFTEDFYTKMTSAHLKPVLKTLQNLKKKGVWLELINLIIPTMNDSAEEIRAKSRWVKQELGPDVPMHFTRFHPTYKLTKLPKTPVKTLERCREVAMESGLRYVYLGNVLGHEGENTFCPFCGKLLIERIGFKVLKNVLKDGACPACKKPIAGKWK
jgi:pyruvate formate lyase activating enzyme